MVKLAKGCEYHVLEGCLPPFRGRSGDAGLDLVVQQDYLLQPHTCAYLPTGVKFNMSSDWRVDIMPRSSVFKKGLIITSTIVDCTYTGEVSTIVVNYSNEPVLIKKGWRLSQCVIQPSYAFQNEEIDLDLEMRINDEKFGSSGD